MTQGFQGVTTSNSQDRRQFLRGVGAVTALLATASLPSIALAQEGDQPVGPSDDGGDSGPMGLQDALLSSDNTNTEVEGTSAEIDQKSIDWEKVWSGVVESYKGLEEKWEGTSELSRGLIQWGVGGTLVAGVVALWRRGQQRLAKQFHELMLRTDRATSRDNLLSSTCWDIHKSTQFAASPICGTLHPTREGDVDIRRVLNEDLAELLGKAQNRPYFAEVRHPQTGEVVQYTGIGFLDLKEPKIEKKVFLAIESAHNHDQRVLSRLSSRSTPGISWDNSISWCVGLCRDEFIEANGQGYTDFNVVRADKFDFTVIARLMGVMEELKSQQIEPVEFESKRLGKKQVEVIRPCKELQGWVDAQECPEVYQGDLPYRFILMAHLLHRSGLTSEQLLNKRFTQDPDFGLLGTVSTPIPSIDVSKLAPQPPFEGAEGAEIPAEV